MTRPRPRQRRSGFTLVELLVVITIIVILIALLVPVITGAISKANDARVTSEIGLLSNALAAFKDRYGDYPPSRIILSETGEYPTTSPLPLNDPSIPWIGTPPLISGSDITLGALAQRSVRYLNKFFPKAVQPTTGPPVVWHDFNGNALMTGAPDTGLIYLQGDECLVFFLGGIPNRSVSTPATPLGVLSGLSGFGRNPQYPFSSPGSPPSAALSLMFSDNRFPTFHEFQVSRLVDPDNDGMPSYIDPLSNPVEGKPFAYYSCYGGNSYDPNDVNFPEIDENTPAFGNIGRAFRVNFPVTLPPAPNTVNSFAPNPYTSSLPVPPGATLPPASWQNPNTFQIISAGADLNFGIGGQFTADGQGDRLPFPDPAAPAGLDPGVRRREADNLSNFTNGRLD